MLAVLLIIYNRPALAVQVVTALREYKPAKVYIAADGPRASSDAELCRLCRQGVVNEIDWDCEVYTRFSDENLGCGRGPSSAISWFFENEECGVILEDDCLPSLSFFNFCEQMLSKFFDTDDVMMVAGFNPHACDNESSLYSFTRYSRTWGWATWRTAWQRFDYGVRDWGEWRWRFKYFSFFYFDLGEALCFGRIMDSLDRRDDVWDAQWFFSLMKHRGLCVVPDANLIVNLGDGVDSTHFQSGNFPYPNLKYGNLIFPLIHPREIHANWVLDIQRLLHNSRRRIRQIFRMNP